MFRDLYHKYRIYGWKKFIWYTLKEIWYWLYAQLIRNSFSQRGEDLFIDRILGFKKYGFYIDIGAGDPIRFNNTKRFYQRGWHGINIEPNVKLCTKLKKDRERDLNLNIAIGKKERRINFSVFFPSSLSTFSEKIAEDYTRQGFRVVKKTKVSVRALTKVFEEYIGKEAVDFLSIDTEGSELDIIKSNHWEKYRPKLICIEMSAHGRDDTGLKIESYLRKAGYVKVFADHLNGIFLDLKLKKLINF